MYLPSSLPACQHHLREVCNLQYHMIAVELRALRTLPFYYTNKCNVQAGYRPLYTSVQTILTLQMLTACMLPCRTATRARYLRGWPSSSPWRRLCAA